MTADSSHLGGHFYMIWKAMDQQRRKEHNRQIIERMKNTRDELLKCSLVDTWFPPRQKIKKDPNALSFGYLTCSEQTKKNVIQLARNDEK